MAEPRDDHEAPGRDPGHHRPDGRDQERRAGASEREEGVGEELGRPEGGKPQREDGQHEGHLPGVLRTEGAPLVDERDERRGDPDETGRGGERQHQHEPAGLPEHPAESLPVAAAGGPRERRKRGARQGDSDQPRGKLHEPVGHREPGEPRGSRGGEVPRDDDVDLQRPGSSRSGCEEAAHPPEGRVRNRFPHPAGGDRAVAVPAEPAPLHEQLDEPSDRHPEGESRHRMESQPGSRKEPQRREHDRGDVEERRSHRGQEEGVPGLETAHEERRERRAGDEREHDPGQPDGQFPRRLDTEAQGLGKRRVEGAPREHEVHQLRREHHAGDGDEEAHREQDPEDPPQEPVGGFFSVTLIHGREGGDERLGKRPLGEHLPQGVREGVGRVEGVEQRGREQEGERLLPHQAGETGEDDAEAHRARAARQVALVAGAGRRRVAVGWHGDSVAEGGWNAGLQTGTARRRRAKSRTAIPLDSATALRALRASGGPRAGLKTGAPSQTRVTRSAGLRPASGGSQPHPAALRALRASGPRAG